ncbi:Uncharacterised protein [Pantoea agglomerans]|uniref:Uncharacterized protein n=1 Tax=Enterobacter agglomerans TaxID=549 RepID=A0A379AF93_ENTAG|nr:Uncharacterised protein [Pantoea agglomerans]
MLCIRKGRKCYNNYISLSERVERIDIRLRKRPASAGQSMMTESGLACFETCLAHRTGADRKVAQANPWSLGPRHPMARDAFLFCPGSLRTELIHCYRIH